MEKTLSVAEGHKRAEEHRQKRRAEALAKFKALTDGKDEWPEHEHEARFEALLTVALFTKPIK